MIFDFLALEDNTGVGNHLEQLGKGIHFPDASLKTCQQGALWSWLAARTKQLPFPLRTGATPAETCICHRNQSYLELNLE